MITSLAWIPRGAARQRPVRFELNADEYERVKTLANEELKTMKAAGEAGDENEDEDGEEDEPQEDEIEVDTSDLPAELDMDNYDDYEESEEEVGLWRLELLGDLVHDGVR